MAPRPAPDDGTGDGAGPGHAANLAANRAADRVVEDLVDDVEANPLGARPDAPRAVPRPEDRPLIAARLASEVVDGPDRSVPPVMSPLGGF